MSGVAAARGEGELAAVSGARPAAGAARGLRDEVSPPAASSTPGGRVSRSGVGTVIQEAGLAGQA